MYRNFHMLKLDEPKRIIHIWGVCKKYVYYVYYMYPKRLSLS